MLGMEVRTVSCEVVAELLQGPMRDDIAIVDVRDEVQ
jgi:hypothetical protein